MDRGSLMKRLYRLPLDWLEETSMGTSDLLIVNSKFTESIFRAHFCRLGHVPVNVLYPPVSCENFDRKLSYKMIGEAWETLPEPLTYHLQKYGDRSIILLSINRFERKKNLRLAIEALDELRELLIGDEFQLVQLVLAGGYDERLNENVSYFKELTQLVESKKLSKSVSFLKSFSDDQRLFLVRYFSSILYR